MGQSRKPGLAGAAAAPEPPPALLAEALRHQSEGVLLMEATGTVKGFTLLYANERFLKMTGLRPQELVGKRLGILHTDAAELARIRHWASRGEPDKAYNGQGDILAKDGHAIFASWSFNRLPPDAEGKAHLVACYRDMTSQHRLQETLMTAQRLDAVGRMAGGVAHDFSNLLSVINSYCQLLSLRLINQPEAKRDLEEIQKAAQTASGLTRQLLALGRKQTLAARVFDLNEFLNSCVDILTRIVGEAGVLELALAPGRLPVRADPDQIQQVLLNLTLNARDALRDKGRVTLGTSKRHIGPHDPLHEEIAAGDYVVLTLTDNGVGMDAETITHIFEPFFTTKTADRGSGLGLALVYGIIQQSSGHIRVSSTLLVGSTFEIFLPLVAEESKVTFQPVLETKVVSSRGHESILVVERDIVLARMISGMLASEAYVVHEAPNLREALAALRNDKFPVQLLIAALAEDGESREFLRELHRANPKLRLLCTTNSGVECPVAKNIGIPSLSLARPFALSELLRAARGLLDRS